MTVQTKRSKAELATLHITQRVIESPDFAHYMLATESLRLCLDAEAEVAGISYDECERRILEAINLRRKSQRRNGGPTAAEPREITLEHRIEELETELSDYRDDEESDNFSVDPDRQKLLSVRDHLEKQKITGQLDWDLADELLRMMAD